MADIAAVRRAIDDAVALLADLDPQTRRKIPDRDVSAWLSDLDVAFAGRLEDGHLIDAHEVEPAQAKAAALRLSLSSDDLVALVAGDLNFAGAWARGRIRVDARLRDLLELRRFL